MGVLGARLGLVAVGLGVMFAVAARNEGLGGGQGLLTDPQGVGTHIGDEAHGALALDIHALVQLLGDGHGPPGRHGELAGRLLLHGGEGLRCLSVRFTVLTVKGAYSVSWTTASTSSADFSSAFLPSFPW